MNDIDRRFDDGRAEVAAFRSEVRAEFHEMRAEFHGLRSEFQGLRADMVAMHRQVNLILTGLAVGLLGLLGASQF